MTPVDSIQRTAEALMVKAAIEIPDDYLGGLRSRAHELQNAGGFNGAYFHQNEQHLNHILSSTLVDLRTAD